MKVEWNWVRTHTCDILSWLITRIAQITIYLVSWNTWGSLCMLLCWQGCEEIIRILFLFKRWILWWIHAKWVNRKIKFKKTRSNYLLVLLIALTRNVEKQKISRHAPLSFSLSLYFLLLISLMQLTRGHLNPASTRLFYRYKSSVVLINRYVYSHLFLYN